jgi:hypothetical protein
MKKLLAGLGLGMLGIPAAWAQQDILTFTTTPDVFNGVISYTLGYEFDVTSPITVTGLSVFAANPAAGLNENTPVGLWDANGNLLASATVPSGTAAPLTLDGLFRYESLAAPMTLPDGSYYVGAEIESGIDLFAAGVNSLSAIPGVTFVQNAFYQGSSLTFPNTIELGLQNAFFGGNVVASSAVPEPESIVLLAVGLVGLAAFGRKFLRTRVRANSPLRHLPAVMILLCAADSICVVAQAAPVVTTVAGSVYHPQIAAHSCTVACMEMQLDCTEVRNNDPFANAMLGIANPDGNLFEPLPNPPLIFQPPKGWVPNPNYVQMPPPAYNMAGNVTANVQTYLYWLSHGRATYPTQKAPKPNSNCYSNPKFGLGTDIFAAQTILNLLDDAHIYIAYLFPNTGATATKPARLKDGDQASRTVANTIADYQIPAIIMIGAGAHAISVYGVKTDVAPGFNAKYDIEGFYVNDPFFGYHEHFPDTSPASTWKDHYYVRYGWDLPKTGGTLTVLPDGTTNRIRLAPWFQKFVPTKVNDVGVAGDIGKPGYKIEVEPEGPEQADGGLYVSAPPPPVELPVE